ncbi:MAG: NAD(+)/NADH kinase [Clostridiales bacterium]|nr:NAD(+)/NADH kinase [Clostridiales bacterium]
MRFGIVVNEDKDPGYAFSKHAVEVLNSRGCEVVFDPYYTDNPEIVGIPGIQIDDYSTCDVLFSMGGDGTFLRTVHKFVKGSLPIIGVNLGSIGFLTEIHKEDFEDAVDRLIAGKYTLENRTQIDVTLCSEDGTVKEHGLCLNDAVIARGANLHVVNLDLLIDHDYVERLSGDGVILSTAMGSTAYCLAAGGPIVKPEMDIFMVTPICPHTLHNRSYVVSGDSTVEIIIGRFSEPPILSLDGRPNITLDHHDRIILKKSETPVVVAKIGYKNFYQTVRQKIRARGSFYEDGEK